MARPQKLDENAITTWLASHPGWETDGHALTRAFTFPDFAQALAFVVRVGLHAERHDHHPDITLGWGKASVRWSTHDAGGITELDLRLAEATEA